MRAAHLLLALVALLLLAGGAWYFTRDSASSATGDLALDRHSGPALEESRAAGGLVDAEPRSDLEAPPKASERTAAASAPSQEVAREQANGERGLAGRVVDEFGSPVARARVFVSRGSAFGELPIDRLATSSNAFTSVEETTTDAEGRYRFLTGLRGELRLAVRMGGFAPLRTRRDVEGEGVVQLEDLVLERGVILSGHVVDLAGNGISGVSLEAIEASSGSGFSLTIVGGAADPLAVSGPGGAFEVNQLAAGPYKLRLSHPEHPDLGVDGSLDRPGQRESGLRLVMEDGFTIAGRVLGLAPGQASELRVRARPAEGEPFDLAGGFGGLRLTELAADGAFELRGLRAGAYRLHAIEGDTDMALFAPGRSAATSARTGDRDVQIQLREPSGLTLRVLDAATGAALENYTVEAGLQWQEPLRDAEGKALTSHPDGRATFADVPLQEGQSRTNLTLSAQGYQTLTRKDIALQPGIVLDLGDLRLEPVAMIRVLVLDDSTGEPIEGARVRLSEVEEAPGPGSRRISFNLSGSVDGDAPAFLGGAESSQARSDGEGLAELASLPGKLCRLSVQQRGYATYRGEPMRLPESGGRELEARLTQGGSVTVLVLGADGAPKKGARVAQSLVGEGGPLVFGGDAGTRTSDTRGQVEFTHLPAGLHNFKLQEGGGAGSLVSGGAQIVLAGFDGGGEQEGVDVEVGEGSTAEITLRARAEGEVHGRVTEAGEPLIGATLSFEEKSEGGGEDMGLMLPGFGGGASARTDSQGEYSQKGLAVGEYTLRLAHPTRAMPTTFELSVREGANTSNHDLPVAILEGRVVDAGGEPVVGLEVRPKRHVEPGPGGARRTTVARMVMMSDNGGGAMTLSTGGEPAPAVKTDADGRYSLRGVAHDTELVVETSSSRYQKAQSKPVVVSENQRRRDVDIEVFEAGHVTVRVRNADGSPASFCLAELDYAGNEKERPEPQREFVGETGEATVDSLCPGRWRVSARTMGMMGPGGDAGEPKKAAPVEVDVEAGGTSVVTLNLEP